MRESACLEIRAEYRNVEGNRVREAFLEGAKDTKQKKRQLEKKPQQPALYFTTSHLLVKMVDSLTLTLSSKMLVKNQTILRLFDPRSVSCTGISLLAQRFPCSFLNWELVWYSLHLFFFFFFWSLLTRKKAPLLKLVTIANKRALGNTFNCIGCLTKKVSGFVLTHPPCLLALT